MSGLGLRTIGYRELGLLVAVVALLVALVPKPATSTTLPILDSAKLPASILDSFQVAFPYSAQAQREEARLTRKLQEALDIVMPGHSRVDIEIDWDLTACLNYCGGALVEGPFRMAKEKAYDSGVRGLYCGGWVRKSEPYALRVTQIRVQVSVTDGVSPKEYKVVAKICHDALGLRDDRGGSVSITGPPIAGFPLRPQYFPCPEQ